MTQYVSLEMHTIVSCYLPQALLQLYYDPDMGQKNVAQKWLAQAQASPYAWHFCWALLSPDKVGTEIKVT